MALHRRTHPRDVDGCWGCKAAGIQFGGEKTPTAEMESRWDRDMPAYKRLREQGYQPKGIDGAAALESRASTRFEIESGQVVPDARKLGDAIKFFEDGTGRSVYEAAAAPREAEVA